MNGFTYLTAAYSVIWIAIITFVWFINVKTNKLEQDLEVLREIVETKK
jgi:CcmD family protein